jgi:Leucine-rich repeat (LRR) protein
MWKTYFINIKSDKKKQKMKKLFNNLKQIITKMYYKLENLEEEIRISSFEELRKKDFWNDIVYLDCSGNEITNLDNLPTNLHTLDCSINKIKNLDNFPPNLQELYCGFNGIKNLDNLPPNLQRLDCYGNEITNLDNLPKDLQELHCSGNVITILDNLPPNLQGLYCRGNKITKLDNLPPNLHTLDCSRNKIKNLDNLPHNLQILYCWDNKITNLDNLPNSLKILNYEKYVKPNILDLYLNKTIDIQQLEKHFELIDEHCNICKTETKCINKCPHKFCIDCILEMYKANKRTDCCVCGKSFV